MLSQEILDSYKDFLKSLNFKSMTAQNLMDEVVNCQKKIINKFNLTNIQVRGLDPVVLNDLLKKMQRSKGIQFIFRHGEQDPGLKIADSSELDKKIAMMQEEHNMADPITVTSAVEFVATVMVLSYLKAHTDYAAHIEYSPNMRAKQPAIALAERLSTEIAIESSALKCVNYKRRVEYGYLDKNGNLPWVKDNVDNIVGLDIFESICSAVKVIAEQSLIENVVNVYVTHTQQIDELRRQAKLSFGRLSNYGFICRDVDGIKIYENGFYSKELMTLSETVSVRASSKGLFGVTPTPLYNVEALQKKSFLFYFATLPSFSDMLKKIQSEHNLFMNVVACEYDWKEFLNSYFDNNVPDLDKTALQFLTEERLINTEDTSENPRILSAKEECYLAVLSDVRHNRLTKEPYEDKENVDEEGHGIQAGIISEQMRMKLEDSLAMTFHDIARTAIEKPDSLYGHANHCSEGDVILSPLKLKTHYSLYHGFAKQLLYIFCEPYKELISPTSEKSRKLQIINLYKELQDLYKLKSKELAFELYKLMFMRLIDDMSKVPPAILKKDLKEHFTEIHIKEMTRKQLLKQSVSSPSEKDQMEEKLDAALRLLLRAQSNSLDPVIYEIHAKVLDNLVSQKSYVM